MKLKSELFFISSPNHCG